MPCSSRTGKRGLRTCSSQEQTPAGAQDPRGLHHGPTIVGDGAERERRDHRVEGGVREREVLGVADAQIAFDVQLSRPLTGDREHLGAQLDPGEARVFMAAGEVTAGANRDL
jgi:hypothetical protein